MCYSEVNVVAIDDDVLSEVGFACESVGVWDSGLVNAPVVEWWVRDWVGGLSEGRAVTRSVSAQLSRVTLGEGGGIARGLGSIGGGGVCTYVSLSQSRVLLLSKSNFIRSNSHVHVEL